VVDTLVDAPAFKTVSTASLPNADTKGTATTNTLRIQLRPVELGEITATISMRGDAITVELMTEKVEAYDRLNVDSDAIVKALRGLGLQVDQVTIQAPAPTSRPEAGVQDQASNRAQQQFTASGHSAGSNSQSQRQPTSHGEQHNVAQARQSSSPANDDRAARGLVI
jgi:chemotaxis protein MotD